MRRCCRDSVLEKQGLGKRLGELDSGGRPRRPENRNIPLGKPVGQAGGKRRFGTDNDEIDAVLQRGGADAFDIGRGNGKLLRQ